MVQVNVSVPGLLRDSIDGASSFVCAAGTLDELLAFVKRDHPRLAAHIWDDRGRVRPHVLIFLNDQSTRWMETTDVPLRPTDRVAIVQATSGG